MNADVPMGEKPTPASETGKPRPLELATYLDLNSEGAPLKKHRPARSLG
jgi:hypothetical protein